MKPLREMPTYGEGVQVQFVNSYEKSPPDLASSYLEPAKIFAARFHHDGTGTRLYHREFNGRFGFGIGAFYDIESGIPSRIIDARFPNGTLGVSFDSQGRSSVMLRGENSSHFFETHYFDRDKSETPLAIARMGTKIAQGQEGQRIVTTPYIPEIKRRKDFLQILAANGIEYDAGEQAFELKMDDLVLRVGEVIRLKKLVDQYFPAQVYAHPDKAATDHDVWSRADWMGDFNVVWNKLVPTPVL